MFKFIYIYTIKKKTIEISEPCKDNSSTDNIFTQISYSS